MLVERKRLRINTFCSRQMEIQYISNISSLEADHNSRDNDGSGGLVRKDCTDTFCRGARWKSNAKPIESRVRKAHALKSVEEEEQK